MSHASIVYNTIINLFDQLKHENSTHDNDDGCYHYPNLFNKSPDHALHVHVLITCENYGYEADGNTHHEEWARCASRSVHLAISSNHAVFANVGHGLMSTLIPQDGWVFMSQHDCAWRDSIRSVITKAMRDVYDECYGDVPKEHLPHPMNIDLNAEIGSSSKLYNFVEIKHAPAESAHTYVRELKSIVPIEDVIHQIK